MLLALAGALALAFAGLGLYVLGATRRAALADRAAMGPGESSLSRLRLTLEARIRRGRAGARVDLWLASSGVSVTPLGFLALSIGAFCAVYAVCSLLFPGLLAAVFGLAAIGGCVAWVERARGQRRIAFVGQLPEVARLLSNGASAGLSLAAAVEHAAAELEEPGGTELQLVVEEMRVGRSLDEALERLSARLPSREVAVLMSTLIIQQRAGGDTVRALQDLAETLDGRKDTGREVRTLMAGAVFTSYVVVAIGLGSLLLLNAIGDDVLQKMTSDPIGLAALAVSSVLYVVGFLLVRRTTRIDV
jgi:tight adherence protein B